MASSFAVGSIRYGAFQEKRPRFQQKISTRIQCSSTDHGQVPSKIVGALKGLAGFAAAMALTISSADAGVILEQPRLKKLTGENVPSKPVPTKAASLESSGDGFKINYTLIALPLTLAACGGLYAAGQKLDPEFDKFMYAAWLKDSSTNGIGYEENYKTKYFTGTEATKTSKR